MEGQSLIELLGRRQNTVEYQKEHWEGTFEEYLDVVRAFPQVTRTAFQRLYGMICSYGAEDIQIGKDKVTRYRFFDDRDENGRDAIFGL